MARNIAANERMRLESREQILAASRKLFSERGFFNCKVADIAVEAGMSQGNIYWYFPGKEEILKAILEDGFGRLESLLAEAEMHPGPSSKKIDTLLDEYIAFGHDHGEFITIFMSLMSHGGVPFLVELGFDTVQIGTRYHQHLAAILSVAQVEGVVTHIDPQFLSMFFFAFFNGLIITYGKDWEHLPPELIKDAVFRLLGKGSRTTRGGKK